MVKRTVSKAPAGHSLHGELQILPVHPTTCWTVTGTSSLHLGPLWRENTGADLAGQKGTKTNQDSKTPGRDMN